MRGIRMKKMFLILVVFILSVFSIYDYFNTSQTTYFISLTNQTHTPKDTLSNIDNDSLNLNLPEGSTFQKHMINKDGNLVVVTKKVTTNSATYYILLYDKELQLISDKEITIPKPDLTNSIYPDIEENVIDIKELETIGNVYQIVTNRNLIYVMFIDQQSQYMSFPYWNIAAKLKNNSVLSYFNVLEGDTIVTLYNGQRLQTPLPLGNYSFLNDDSLLSINKDLIIKYDIYGNELWNYKYKEMDNHAQFNDVINLKDGNIVLVGSYHPTDYVEKSQLFNKSAKIKSIRDGVIIKINAETGDVIWEQNIKGYVNDKIDLLNVVECDKGNLDVFGFYDILSPTIFFSIRLDAKGNIMGDKIYQYSGGSVIKEESDKINEGTTYKTKISSLFYDDTSPYNQDKIIIFGNQVKGSDEKPFMIQYASNDYKNEINYLNADTYKYHNYLILIDTVVCGLIVVSLIYLLIKKFDRRSIKKSKKSKK